MVIKYVILKAFRVTMSDRIKTTNEYLQDLEKRFAKNENDRTSTLLVKLISRRCKGKDVAL